MEMPAPRATPIADAGPPHGRQTDRAQFSPADKIAFVNRLSAAGLAVIEVSAFVSPKWVPQMADASEVFAGITRRAGTRYTALVPNLAGLDRAQAAGVSEVAVFAASTETFSRKNINQGIDASLTAYAEVCATAIAAGLRGRGYLSTAFGCPFEGAVDARRVAEIAGRLIAMGAYQVAVSDTIGIAHPGQVPRVLEAVLARVPARHLALPFHDTRGTAPAHLFPALPLGLETLHAAARGLGGCPYAPRAAGHLAPADLIFMLRGRG